MRKIWAIDNGYTKFDLPICGYFGVLSSYCFDALWFKPTEIKWTDEVRSSLTTDNQIYSNESPPSSANCALRGHKNAKKIHSIYDLYFVLIVHEIFTIQIHFFLSISRASGWFFVVGRELLLIELLWFLSAIRRGSNNSSGGCWYLKKFYAYKFWRIFCFC